MDDELDLFPDQEHSLGVPVPMLEVRDVVLDPAFGKRRDALLRTAPLHALVDRARSVPDLQDFDVRALALAAFDAVIARQGFSEPATPHQVTSLLASIAEVQVPASQPAARQQVADVVLDGLTNRRERDRQFTYTSIIYVPSQAGQLLARSVPRPFWLLRELENPATGAVYLEASVDAVNTLVGALDLPIEDEQAAAEVVLERQLDRGDLNAAYLSAVRTSRLSVGYTAKVDELLRETARYLPGTDWQSAAPALIRGALDHVSTCIKSESGLLDHIQLGRNENGDRSSVAGQLTTLLRRTQHLHIQLLARLEGARVEFLDAQDAQMFRPVLSTLDIDPLADVLIPVLELPVADAEAVVEEHLRGVLGAVVPRLVSWGDLVESLLRPPERGLEEPVEAQDATEFRPDPPPLIDADLLARTRGVIARVSLPTRLSRLIAACPPPTGAAATPVDLIVLAALRGYDNAERDHESERPPPALHASDGIQVLDILGADVACYSDGLQLQGLSWAGDDLLICADRDQLDGVLLGDLPTPEPVSLFPNEEE